jgi:hypothetical protein
VIQILAEVVGVPKVPEYMPERELTYEVNGHELTDEVTGVTLEDMGI